MNADADNCHSHADGQDSINIQHVDQVNVVHPTVRRTIGDDYLATSSIGMSVSHISSVDDGDAPLVLVLNGSVRERADEGELPSPRSRLVTNVRGTAALGTR